MSFHGINVFGTIVPTDHLQLCYFDADQNMIADKRVRYVGTNRNRTLSIMVCNNLQSYGQGPAVFQSYKLRRTKAENLYPMTPELQRGQQLVQQVIDHIYRDAGRANAQAINAELNRTTP